MQRLTSRLAAFDTAIGEFAALVADETYRLADANLALDRLADEANIMRPRGPGSTRRPVQSRSPWVRRSHGTIRAVSPAHLMRAQSRSFVPDWERVQIGGPQRK